MVPWSLPARVGLATVLFLAPLLLAHRVGQAPPRVRVGLGALLVLPLLVPPVLLGGILSERLPLGRNALIGTWFIGVVCITCALRLIDYLGAPPAPSSAKGSFVACLEYIVGWPDASIDGFRAPLLGPRLPIAVRSLSTCAAKLVGGLALTVVGASLGLPLRSLALDRVLMMLEIWALGSGFSDLVVGASALRGYHVTHAFDWPVRARSVLDFWARYDRWVGRGLKRNVYDRLAPRGRVLGVLATFGASGVAHEYLFDVVVPQMIGRQMLFFSLHGVAAVGGAWLERKLRPRSRPARALAVLVTLSFVYATAGIFLGCLAPFGSLNGDLGGFLLGEVRGAVAAR